MLKAFGNLIIEMLRKCWVLTLVLSLLVKLPQVGLRWFVGEAMCLMSGSNDEKFAGHLSVANPETHNSPSIMLYPLSHASEGRNFRLSRRGLSLMGSSCFYSRRLQLDEIGSIHPFDCCSDWVVFFR